MVDEEIARNCVANLLRTAARALNRHYDSALKELDLKASQLSVLAAVSLSSGDRSIVEVAKSLGMDRSTLSRNLEPLERRGLVSLGPEERHRARHIVVTEDGAALLSKAYPLWKQAQAAVTSEMENTSGLVQQLGPLIERFG